MLAEDLAGFVAALHAVDPPAGRRRPGERGTPIRLGTTRSARPSSLAGDRIDGPAALAAWEHCLEAPDHAGAPVWLHGDLLAGNLLVDDGRLAAVIDFGALGVGDPAPDLQPYWSTLTPDAAATFRRVLDERCGYDDATWRRGRGWSLGPALTGIPYYWDTVPAFAQRGLRSLERVLADLS